MKRKRIGILALLSLFFAGNASAATFQVRHDHLWGSCKGELVFKDATVEYSTKQTKHNRVWRYEDIQQLEILPNRITVLTYNIRKRDLGSDQAFHFKVLPGDLSDQFRKEVESKLLRPLVSAIVPERPEARYTILVRHRRFLDDSQGALELGEDYVVYRSGQAKESRIWRYDELLSVGSTGPFQLRIGAVQKTGGEYGEEKNYIFDLKRQLKTEEYDFIWEKINRPQIAPEADGKKAGVGGKAEERRGR